MTGTIDDGELFGVHLPGIGTDRNGARYAWKATADQCSSLADRFGCVEIQGFEVTATIKPLRKEGYFRVNGAISARVVQNCVVSLEPVVSGIETAFGFVLVPETEDVDAGFEDEEYETYTGNRVDLGEIGAIELALALDPYPRAPGVSIADLGPGGADQGYEISDQERAGRNRPFEALAVIKRKS